MIRKRILSRKRTCALTAAVLSALSMSMTCGASESPYLATEYSYYQGNPFIEFKILRQGEGIGPSGTKEVKWLVEPALFDLSSALIKGTVDSTAYWTAMLGQKVNSAANTYFAAGLGVEFKRFLNKGSYAMRVGLRQAFSGANPRVTFGYAGGGPTVYELRGQQDKTHLLL